MTRPARFAMAALAIIAAAGVLLALPATVRSVPPTVPLEAFATDLPPWRGSGLAPKEVLPPEDGAAEHVLRRYDNGPRRVWVAVGYYPNQAEGNRPPARQLLFPRSGWADLSEQTVSLPLGAGSDRAVPVTLVVKRDSAQQRIGILYWYHLPGRSIGSDHWYRVALMYNRLVHSRADGALVRVAFPIPGDADPTAVALAQADFVRLFHTELARSLPR